MRRAIRTRASAFALALLVLAGVHLATAVPAAACSCVPADESHRLPNSDAVFVGDISRASSDGEVYRFAVSAVYKGAVVSDQAVLTGGRGRSNPCPVAYTSGRFLVFAFAKGEQGRQRIKGPALHTHMCGMVPVTGADSIPSGLGTPSAPIPGQTELIAPTVRQRLADARGVLFTGAVLVAIGLIAWRRRRQAEPGALGMARQL